VQRVGRRGDPVAPHDHHKVVVRPRPSSA
jgi:hypothetical protein